MPSGKTPADTDRLDRLVAEARRNRELREQGYRDRALKLFPWVCARCAREFTRANARLLTVHHKDGNHDNNPPNGSNWELLCVYCHENEHARAEDAKAGGGAEPQTPAATHRPPARLGGAPEKKS